MNAYALLVKLWTAANSDPRYMKIWQDIVGAVSLLLYHDLLVMRTLNLTAM